MWRRIASMKSLLLGLTLASLITWKIWTVPRIDRGLIGRWECVTPTPGRQFVTLYLRGDGRGKYLWEEAGDSRVVDYPWAVCGSTLRIQFAVEPDERAEGIWRIVDGIERLIAVRQAEKKLRVLADPVRHSA